MFTFLCASWSHFMRGVSERPGAPGVPNIDEVSGTSMALSWSSPRDDGGCRVDGYIVEYREEFGKWTRASADAVSGTDYTVRGLKSDTVYEFRVAAQNKAGVGEFSGSSKSTKAVEQIGMEISALVCIVSITSKLVTLLINI